MKTVEEVRRLRLKLLKEEYGSLTALSAKLDMTPRDSTLSQLLNGSTGSKTKKPKEMGSAMARRLERACGKEIGWMDTDPELTADLFVTSGDQLPAGAALPKGAALTRVLPEELAFLDNFRILMDDDQKQYADEISDKAAKLRAHAEKLFRDRFGANLQPVKNSADAKKTEAARSALELTERLRQEAKQQGLFEPGKPPPEV